ncbi:MAG: chemotaxis protein CheW [Thioalkalispiraceae bacterium]|jgi:purine-binding chemotaxis protein CheW
MSKNSNKLVDQSQALDSFFESLLRDVEAYAENEIQQPEEPQQIFHGDITPLSEQPEPIIAAPVPEQETEQQADTRIFETIPPVAPEPIHEQAVEDDLSEISEAENIAAEESEEQESVAEMLGKPAWAESEFQVMLFKVAGLTLAVPLVELNGIVECDLSNVTAMPGHADFYLGLMNHLDKTVPLVDTARFVLPPDKLQLLAGADPQERITRVVMIHDCQYGLACDEVNEVITLSPDSVRWRTQRTQRRWLAGTVIEHMCALIDANAFAELLASRAPIQDFRE